MVDKDTPVKEISHIVWNEHPDALLVEDTGKIVGIITDSDIIMKVDKKDIGSNKIKAKDIMSSPVITIEAGKEISEAIDLMSEKGIQKLLVVENGTPIGVIYGEDILERDEEKWKEILFNQTVEEVYKISLKTPKADIASVSYRIKEMDKFSNMESQVEFDLRIYQDGIILVAFNYIKENPSRRLEQLKTDIKENYSELLEKYSRMEE